MNPKKRAIKIKSRFQNEVGMFDNECKKSAIIAVEEIIIAFDDVMIPNPFKQYWKTVIKEIELLKPQC